MAQVPAIDQSTISGILLEIFADPGFEPIIERAPDVAGSPGTYVVLDRLLPGTMSFFDPLPNDGSLWWYRLAQGSAGYNDSGYAPAVQAAVSVHFINAVPQPAMVLAEIPRSFSNATTGATIVQNLQDTGHLASAMQESGGKAVARLLAKPLAADPDDIDSVTDGTTYKRTTANEKTGAGRGYSALNGSNRLTTGLEGDQNLVGGSLYIEAAEAPLVGTVASPSSIEKTLYIPGPMFIGKRNDVPWEIHTDGITIYGATATERILWCAILVAPGVELTEIAMRSYRDFTAEQSLLRIYRVDGDTSTSLATIDDTNTPVSTNRTLTAALSETSTVGRTYILEWDAKTENPSATPKLRWARLKYRMADYRVSI